MAAASVQELVRIIYARELYMADHMGHATRLLEAFNNADWDSMSNLFGNSTYNEFGTQRVLEGDDSSEAMRGWKTAMPDVKGTVTSSAESGDQVVLEVTWHGTHTGPLATPEGEIPPSGRTQTTPAVWIFDFKGDSLNESRHYFDMLTFLQQIGAA
jgi:steroid delta-isomerase-like uncharacterized protein